MVWGGACHHLLWRDEYIGWTPSLRARRLKLIASNRRFTILAKPGERRNLASQCLALAAREIPGLWMRKFHYRPLLAETFCDIEHSAGTCYKAAGWTPLGMTKGFTRTNRQECDFYVPNDRPKTLWVKPLVPNALELLNARELPADCALGAQGNSDGVMPIGKEQRESLYDALCRVRDTRDSNRTFHIGGMLSIVVMAMMGGAQGRRDGEVRDARRAQAPVGDGPHQRARLLGRAPLPARDGVDRRALQRREPRADKGQPEGTARERPGGRQGQSPRGL